MLACNLFTFLLKLPIAAPCCARPGYAAQFGQREHNDVMGKTYFWKAVRLARHLLLDQRHWQL
jgi:hypothetical protein